MWRSITTAGKSRCKTEGCAITSIAPEWRDLLGPMRALPCRSATTRRRFPDRMNGTARKPRWPEQISGA
jgi:hypothetical protein